MDFEHDYNRPAKRFSGMMLVALLHIGMIYALTHGLAVKVVEYVRGPVETHLVEEIKPLPPLQELLPEPTLHAPPPVYLPPPEVHVSAPVPVNAITSFTTALPVAPPPLPAPPVVAPPAPKPVPVAVSKPVAARADAVCTNFGDVKDGLGDKFARLADRENIDAASVTLLINMSASGQFTEIRVESASNRAVADLARSAVSRLRCTAHGMPVQLLVPFSFRLDD